LDFLVDANEGIATQVSRAHHAWRESNNNQSQENRQQNISQR